MLIYIIAFVILILVLVGYVIIRDLLYIIEYLKYQYKIKIENKNYKKYHEEKKLVLEKRLQQEKELRQKYQMDLNPVQEQEYIVGFVKPIGRHTNAEFSKNSEKYAKIASAMKTLQSKGIKNAYWRIITNTAHKIVGLENVADLRNNQQQKSNQRSRGR